MTLDAVGEELQAAHRELLSALMLCAVRVEKLADEGDEEARLLALLVAGAETRCAVARFEAAFLLPAHGSR